MGVGCSMDVIKLGRQILPDMAQGWHGLGNQPINQPINQRATNEQQASKICMNGSVVLNENQTDLRENRPAGRPA